jgi:putative tryptophan/tyrosine transport system substrate-binding protein
MTQSGRWLSSLPLLSNLLCYKHKWHRDGPRGHMRRRDFIKVIATSAAAWPLVARAQQTESMRRIGVLLPHAADDPQGQTRLAALLQQLQPLGWSVGRNVLVDTRWGAGDADRYRKYAAELVALTPDVIVVNTSPIVAAVQQATSTIPIVFVEVIDPVGGGFVSSLARPGGNTTGFAIFDYGISGKWLALLKEIAPGVTRALVLRDPTTAAGIGQFAAIQSVAPSLGIELSPIDVRNVSALERAVAEFARTPNGGAIVPASPPVQIRREQVAALFAKHRLPAVYPFRYFVDAGGLISCGPSLEEAFRPAAGYVDRILKGEKPADLPVQTPDKYELVINLKTAKALGLALPSSVLARADKVIE